MPGRVKLKKRPIRPAGLMLLAAVTPLGFCGMQASSGTERTVCRELRADLPSYSRQDTAETLASGARFSLIFQGVCG